MKRISMALALLLALTGLVVAQDPLPLATAHGQVEKVDKDALMFQPREGTKFGKAIALKLTGTSKISTLTSRDGGKVVVQRDADSKDLRPKQAIAVIYTTTKDGHVLLSAVAHPAEK